MVDIDISHMETKLNQNKCESKNKLKVQSVESEKGVSSMVGTRLRGWSNFHGNGKVSFLKSQLIVFFLDELLYVVVFQAPNHL